MVRPEANAEGSEQSAVERIEAYKGGRHHLHQRIAGEPLCHYRNKRYGHGHRCR